MLWIKIAVIFLVLIALFLYVILHVSARSVDDEMQNKLDEEQARIVSKLMEKQDGKRTG